MIITSFFNSWPGMYLAQSFLHSLIAAIIVDTSLIAWKVEDPFVRQRFRLLVVVLPTVSFPLYQAVSTDRGSALFRLSALFDVNRWLNLELWGAVPLGALFLLLLAFSTLIFLVQEVAPILRHRGSETGFEVQDPPQDSALDRALHGLAADRPPVLVLDDPEPLIFSATGRDPVIYVTQGLIDAFTESELRAALGHEIGHIRRSRRPAMVLVFLLRVLMFYNPVILMEFRRIVLEEEKICDDMAIAMTGDRDAMAAALRKLFAAEEDARSANEDAPQKLHERIEDHSHSLLIESRLARLEEPRAPQAQAVVVFGIVLATILLVNYFVV